MSQGDPKRTFASSLAIQNRGERADEHAGLIGLIERDATASADADHLLVHELVGAEAAELAARA
jgi:hypothetical protein